MFFSVLIDQPSYCISCHAHKLNVGHSSVLHSGLLLLSALDVILIVVIDVMTATKDERTAVGETIATVAATMIVAVTMSDETEIVAVTTTESETATRTRTGIVAVAVVVAAVTTEVATTGGEVAAEVGVEMETDVTVTKVAIVLCRHLSR